MHQAEMAAHLNDEYRKRQHQRDPESPGHVDQLGIGRIVERDLFGLQRHAADRTTARTYLLHFRMHRTGVDGAGRRFRLGLLRLQEFFRLGLETLAATLAAEEVVLAAIGKTMLGGLDGDAHAADGIGGDRRRRGAVAAAAAGRGSLPGPVMRAGMRVGAVSVLHLHQVSPGLLNYIP
jgi:hypothetical protein